MQTIRHACQSSGMKVIYSEKARIIHISVVDKSTILSNRSLLCVIFLLGNEEGQIIFLKKA